MNDETQQQDNDHEGLSRLYRQGATEQPPATLDGLIRNLARRELKKKAFRFGIPLSAAAGLLLALGLTRLVLQQMPEDENLVDNPVAPLEEVVTEDEAPPKRAMSKRAEASDPAPAPPATFGAGVAEAVKAQKEKKRARSLIKRPEAPPKQVLDKAASFAEPLKLEHDADARMQTPANTLLLQIRRLLQQGAHEKARLLLERYRQEHPAMPVPEDLMPLLERRR